MRSWVLNQPYEIIIVTVGNKKQKELKRIADTSVACDITRVLQINRAHKRFQLVHGVHLRSDRWMHSNTTKFWRCAVQWRPGRAVCFCIATKE